MDAALRYVWTWPGIDPADLDPTSLTVVKDRPSAGSVFHVDMSDPARFHW
jgi:hypothetical protein